jgi:CubicO group peptidase (beta-lactamase class C family)
MTIGKRRDMTSGLLRGQLDARFEPLRDVLEDSLGSTADRRPPTADCGLSLAVDVDGRTVVDVYGGFTDEARTRPWERDTIVNVWSTTKPVTSLAVLMLADRGLVDLDAPVARYWPEFAAQGKEGVLVRQLMGHTSGVAGWNTPFAFDGLYDLERSTAALAAQAPWWEPGTASGYHALSFGYLLGEVVRRVTGKSLTRFVDEEIAGPLGADFQIGARQADWGRCAEIIPPPLPVDLARLPRAGARDRPVPRGPATLRHRLRASRACRGFLRARGQGVLLGRLGRIHDHHGPGPSHDHLLPDEQDAAGAGGFRPCRRVPEGIYGLLG